MMTQTSTVEIPKEEKNETDDDKKEKKEEKDKNGDVVKATEQSDFSPMGHVKMTSAKCLDVQTRSLLSAFGTDLDYGINTTSRFTYIIFFWDTTLPPLLRTSYVVLTSPLQVYTLYT